VELPGSLSGPASADDERLSRLALIGHDSMMDAGVAVGVVIGLGFSSIFMWWWTRNSFASTPKGVLRHLRKAGAHRTRIRAWEGIWNPAKPPGIDNRIFGPGEATYWLDESEIVHLEFRNGDRRDEYTGPIPASLFHPTELDLHARKRLRSMLLGLVALMVIGCVVGAIVSGGSALHRLLGAWIGLLASLTLMWLVLLVTRVAHALQSLAQDKESHL
jgi:hypothetical protein